MKERDIVDFTKMTKNENGELIDENGKEIGCMICYTHEKAAEKFDEKLNSPEYEQLLYQFGIERVAFCPKCGSLLVPCYDWTDSNEMAIVSEENVSLPDGNIGYYHICECTNEECTDKYGNRSIFALMPEPIEYNGNHSIFYTGGRTYLEDNDMQELSNQIFKAIQPSINNYIERKLNPENGIDKNLNIRNIELWASRDVNEILANWFYEHGMKK